MRKYVAATLLVSAMSAACSTTDFSTPVVNLQSRLAADSSRVCTPSTTQDEIRTATVDHARSLIQNFVLVYRCRSREAANGRQFFQLPAFFAVAGAAAASAFGAGADVGIAGGVASSIFNAGNSYYSPQRQAEIFDSALDALTCIQTEAVGISAFDLRRLTLTEAPRAEGGGAAGAAAGSAVHTSPEAQYYDMILAALFSVERVAASRLRSVGTYDPAGVVAQITALNQEVTETEDRAETSNPVAGGEGGGGSGAAAAQRRLRQVRIDLQTLQPKLERCVVRAKI